MPKAKKLDALLTTLDQIKADPTTDFALDQLKQILSSKYGVAVARATKLIQRAEIHSLLPDLIPAFDRFLTDPIKTDPSCLAKIAIADALYRMEFNLAEPFLKGIRYTQMEPVYGGQMDTAPQLRITCALGLVRMHYPQIFTELADLLADPETPVRIGAAQAIAYTEDRDRGAPLLRLRALCGDEPEAIAAYLQGLLQLDPQPSLSLVSQLLHSSSPPAQELIALLLGESHRPEALEILTAWWQHTRDLQLRQTGLVAIAMIRSDQAFEWLLTVISQGSEADARAVIEALRSYRQDQILWQQVTERTQARGWDVDLIVKDTAL